MWTHVPMVYNTNIPADTWTYVPMVHTINIPADMWTYVPMIGLCNILMVQAYIPNFALDTYKKKRIFTCTTPINLVSISGCWAMPKIGMQSKLCLKCMHHLWASGTSPWAERTQRPAIQTIRDRPGVLRALRFIRLDEHEKAQMKQFLHAEQNYFARWKNCIR